jgi:Rrf2 family protein
MRLRRETEYALRALVFLALRPGGTVCSAPEIATVQDIPGGFLSKIFQKLASHGVLKSHRGHSRGYSLARPPRQITLREILESMEGADLFEHCLFREDRCGERDPCHLHREWSRITPQLVNRLRRKTLAGLATGQGE